jgi:predicted nucleic acid-binding Zn ribbon protein
MIRKNAKLISFSRGEKWREYEPLASILEEWYGKETGSTEMISHLPDAIPIQQALNNIVGTSINPENSDLLRLKDDWEKLVGKDIANIAKPKNIKNGIIYIEVANSAWMMELKNYSKKMIMKNISDLYGEKLYKDMVFVPSG